MKPLFARLTDETATTYDLVLRSAGITCQLHQSQDKWMITVPAHQRRSAVKAISLYLDENPSPPTSDRSIDAPWITTWSAFYIAPLLALIHWAIRPGTEHRIFVEHLGADARRILSGEFYRCVTALFLHQDWPHVVNNMAGLMLFGTVAASVCGWGAGWCMILLSGVFGNLLTAMWYERAHLSIGASTAVFGALGICVALNLWRYARKANPSWRMWLPLAGGLALLGFLGGSPHSDLMAHLTGFGCGLTIGGLYGGFRREPWKDTVQIFAATVGVLIISLSWIWGVAGSGG